MKTSQYDEYLRCGFLDVLQSAADILLELLPDGDAELSLQFGGMLHFAGQYLSQGVDLLLGLDEMAKEERRVNETKIWMKKATD